MVLLAKINFIICKPLSLPNRIIVGIKIFRNDEYETQVLMELKTQYLKVEKLGYGEKLSRF